MQDLEGTSRASSRRLVACNAQLNPTSLSSALLQPCCGAPVWQALQPSSFWSLKILLSRPTPCEASSTRSSGAGQRAHHRELSWNRASSILHRAKLTESARPQAGNLMRAKSDVQSIESKPRPSWSCTGSRTNRMQARFGVVAFDLQLMWFSHVLL